MRMRSMLFTYC